MWSNKEPLPGSMPRDLAQEAQSIVSSIFRSGRATQENGSDTGVFSSNVTKKLNATARAIEDATDAQQDGFDELFDLLKESIESGKSIHKTESALLHKMSELIEEALLDSEKNPDQVKNNDKFITEVNKAAGEIQSVPKSSIASNIKNNFVGGLAGAGYQDKVMAKKSELASQGKSLGFIDKAKMLTSETISNSMKNLSMAYDRQPYGMGSGMNIGYGNRRVRDFAGTARDTWGRGRVPREPREPKEPKETIVEGTAISTTPNRGPMSEFQRDTGPRVQEYDEMMGKKGKGKGKGRNRPGGLTAVEVMSNNFGELMLEVRIIRAIMERKEKLDEQRKIAGRVDKNLMDDHAKLNGSDAPTVEGSVNGLAIPVNTDPSNPSDPSSGGMGYGMAGAGAAWLANKARKGMGSIVKKVKGLGAKPIPKSPVRARDAKGRFIKGPAVANKKSFGSKMLEKIGIKTAGKKAAAKTSAKVAQKSGAKLAEKTLGKAILKKIPGIGLLLGTGFAAQRLMDGDAKGAGLEFLSGAASTVPGIGTAASLGIDAKLGYDDYQRGKVTEGNVTKLEPVRAKAVQEMTEGLDASSKSKPAVQTSPGPVIINTPAQVPPSIPKGIGSARTTDNSFLRFADKRQNRIL
jgi:hypothetical protein